MRLQHAWLDAVATQHVLEGLDGRTVERHVAEDQRVCAGLARLLQDACNGILGHVAIKQWRAKRAIGIGADQCGQGDLVGAPHRNDGHETEPTWKHRSTR